VPIRTVSANADPAIKRARKAESIIFFIVFSFRKIVLFFLFQINNKGKYKLI
jgi:hypothetical protein